MEKFRIIEIQDMEPLRARFLAFGERNNAPTYSNSRIDWLYRSGSGKPGNPCGPTDTWLAVSGGGKEDVIGCGSLYPCTFYSRGEAIPAAVAVDFRVDDQYRVFGPALKIQRAIISASREKGYRFAFVYPNEESIGVFARVGYQPVGTSKIWIRILKSKGKLSGIVKSPALLVVLPALIDGILSAMHWLRYRPGFGKFHSEILDRCSDDFNDLWKREKDSFDFVPEKTAEFLNWRYSSHPAKKHSYFCLFDADTRTLRGFVLFSLEDDNVSIKDVFPANGRWLEPLLWKFISEMKRRDAQSVKLTYFGSDDFIRTIRRYGFVERESAREYMFCFQADVSDGYLELLRDRRTIFLFFG